MYLDVFMFGQAGRDAGQDVVVEVQLPQVGDIGQRAVLHRADLVAAQAQPAGTRRGGENKGQDGASVNGDRGVNIGVIFLPKLLFTRGKGV